MMFDNDNDNDARSMMPNPPLPKDLLTSLHCIIDYLHDEKKLSGIGYAGKSYLA